MENKIIQFRYVNKIIYYGTIIFLLIFGIMTNKYMKSINNERLEFITICIFNIVLIITLISLTFLNFKGTFQLNEENVIIKLKYREYNIPYEKITNVRYYSARKSKGIIIYMGIKSIYIEEYFFGKEELYNLYLKLSNKIKV